MYIFIQKIVVILLVIGISCYLVLRVLLDGAEFQPDSHPFNAYANLQAQMELVNLHS